MENKNNPNLSKNSTSKDEPLPSGRGEKNLLYPLNRRYVFENFVVGTSNQFAHAVSLAVADYPATEYNPLFIYGGVGLGKTHLLNAIGHRVLHNRPHFNVCYISADQFMNEFIVSLRNRNTQEFRERFRQVDMLLIDDIQFLAGKESTQEEFFHTFNTLYESHHQIVMTSDKFPKEISHLEERLRSRFEWGLIADIQPPEMETKVAILKNKAVAYNIPLPDDVAFFLSSKIKSNIRELEGMLIRIGAFSKISRSAVTLEMAREALKDLLPETESLTIEKIQEEVASFFDIKISELKSQKKSKVITFPRQLAMYLSRQLTEASFPEIGARFRKDHSTIIHACRKIAKQIQNDSETRNIINYFRDKLG